MAFPVNNIRQACALAGITLAELERELKYGNGVIAKWEKTKKAPPYDRLAEIADRFGLSVDDLSNPDYPAWEMAAAIAKRKTPISEDERHSEDDKVIEFLRSLPKDRLRGILLSQGAPADVIAELDQQE